jgi:O-antigen biosynthesis protein
MTKISIIIVSWNTKDLLNKCLRSIYDSTGDLELEVFVIDNNSGDGSVEMVKKSFPQVKLIANDNNVGFGRANNQGIDQSTGDYILILNPDTELEKDTLEKSVKFMKENSDCGIVGPKMTFKDGGFQPSVRIFPTFIPILLMLTKLTKIFKFKSVSRYLAEDFDYSKTQVVDQVMGAYMFTSRSALDKVGGFDERFFLWFEEVDLCKRFSEGGFKVMYSPNIKIVHYGGQSFSKQRVVTKQWRFFQSAFKYFIKHGIR